MPPRYFTLDEANATLPHVAQVMTRALQAHALLHPLTRVLAERGVEVSSALLSGAPAGTEDRAVLRMVARAQALYEVLGDCVHEIEQTGAEVKDLAAGLVDFRSLRDGTQEVLLCWQVGEPRITHYHELQAGLRGRRPVRGHDFTSRPRTGRGSA